MPKYLHTEIHVLLGFISLVCLHYSQCIMDLGFLDHICRSTLLPVNFVPS